MCYCVPCKNQKKGKMEPLDLKLAYQFTPAQGRENLIDSAVYQYVSQRLLSYPNAPTIVGTPKLDQEKRQITFTYGDYLTNQRERKNISKAMIALFIITAGLLALSLLITPVKTYFIDGLKGTTNRKDAYLTIPQITTG